MGANQTNRRAVALLLLVFVLGIALGAVGTYMASGRVWGARPQGKGHYDRRAHMLGRLTQELTLSAEQQKQIDAILGSMQEKYSAIHEQIAPQTGQVRQQGREQIRAVLTPEQKPKFEDFLRRLDEERKERKKKNGR